MHVKHSELLHATSGRLARLPSERNAGRVHRRPGDASIHAFAIITPGPSRTVSLVSAVLLTYNCQSLVGDAVRGILRQDYAGPMEVVASDDASTDQTFDVLQAELAAAGSGAGRHVRLLRRTSNSGSKSAHLNDVLPRTAGEIVISFDADDIAEPWRVSRIVEAFAGSPSVQAVYSSFSQMDPAGQPLGAGFVPHPPNNSGSARWFARVDAYASGATLAVRRPVIEQFGRLEPDINEDIVLPFRASLLGECTYLDAPLVRVRRHAGSLTADHERFASLAAYRARMLLGIERAHRNLQSRMADIQRAEELMPERSAYLAELRRIAQESVWHAELTAGLLAPALTTRLTALLRLRRIGAYPDELLQHAALAIAPQVYLAYKRSTLSVKR
jgi:glycosyltransferase involved in cell wall biosynthesis